MSATDSGVESSPVQNITAQYSKVKRVYQQTLDRWTPYMLNRWLVTAGLLATFFLRIVLAQGVSLHSLSFRRPDVDFRRFYSGISVSLANPLTLTKLIDLTAVILIK